MLPRDTYQQENQNDYETPAVQVAYTRTGFVKSVEDNLSEQPLEQRLDRR